MSFDVGVAHGGAVHGLTPVGHERDEAGPGAFVDLPLQEVLRVDVGLGLLLLPDHLILELREFRLGVLDLFAQPALGARVRLGQLLLQRRDPSLGFLLISCGFVAGYE